MQSEWLCRTGVAAVVNELGRSVITQTQGQQTREPASTLYDHTYYTTLWSRHILMYSSCIMTKITVDPIHNVDLCTDEASTTKPLPIGPVTFFNLIQF